MSKINYDDALKLKIGDTLYEYGYGMSIESTVSTQPTEVPNGDDDTMVKWEAVTKDGTVVNYGISREYQHYGPNVYTYQAYDCW